MRGKEGEEEYKYHLLITQGGLEAKQWVQSGPMDLTQATDNNDWEDEAAASASAQLLHKGRVENHPVI